MIIAIDGPSGVGKGTVARAIAAELGYRHVDSGAMYRAVGWKAIQQGIAFDSEADLAALASTARIEISATEVTIDGTDVTRAIRTPEIDKAAASVARLPKVREILVERQRALIGQPLDRFFRLLLALAPPAAQLAAAWCIIASAYFGACGAGKLC